MSWQKILSSGCRSVKELLFLLDLSQDLGSDQAELEFPTRVTRRYIDKIQKKNPQDPLLKQILATTNELKEMPGYSKDPLEEASKNPLPGVLHKYHGRVLITLTGSCAINCRYCFRRHFAYENNKLPQSSWPELIKFLSNDPTIHEIILSGGDPLLVNNHYFEAFLQQISQISHIKTLRIHTRLPTVLPERIDKAWLEIMAKITLNKVVVLHTNHPNEWDDDIHQVCLTMHKIGITLLNQSVLLAGVNDDVKILENLSHVLFKSKVLPYYLHILDPVQGAHEFFVPDLKIKKIYNDLQAQLPGYLVPKLVKEIANKNHKILYNVEKLNMEE